MAPESNASLFDNPVLFRAGGIDWSVMKVCLATGTFLLLLTGLLMWILASHTKGAKWQTMSSVEAADLASHRSHEFGPKLGRRHCLEI